MFDYLEFIKHLIKSYFNSGVKLNRFFEKELSIKERTAKGNISVLKDYSRDNRNRYTSFKYKEQVIKDYNSLK